MRLDGIGPLSDRNKEFLREFKLARIRPARIADVMNTDVPTVDLDKLSFRKSGNES